MTKWTAGLDDACSALLPSFVKLELSDLLLQLPQLAWTDMACIALHTEHRAYIDRQETLPISAGQETWLTCHH